MYLQNEYVAVSPCGCGGFSWICLFMFFTVAEPQMVTRACSCFSQLKFAALRGERYRVIGERGGPAGMWRLEGGKWGLSSSHPDITGRWNPVSCRLWVFLFWLCTSEDHTKNSCQGGWLEMGRVLGNLKAYVGIQRLMVDHLRSWKSQSRRQSWRSHRLWPLPPYRLSHLRRGWTICFNEDKLI